MNRSQIMITSSIVLVLLIVIAVSLYSSYYPTIEQDIPEDLQSAADLVATTLAGEGVPDGWTTENLKKPGLLQDSLLDSDKLSMFQGIPYATTKLLLGITDEYVVFFENEDGRRHLAGKAFLGWNDDQSSGNGAAYWEPYWQTINAQAEELAYAERTVTFDDGWKGLLTVYVWTGSPSPLNPCFDGKDNDGDTLVDYPWDPGCETKIDKDENDDPSDPPQCSDGLDNNADGQFDFPNDPGCSCAADDDEVDIPPSAPCAPFWHPDWKINVDWSSFPGCEHAGDADPSIPNGLPACKDYVDNDGDGYVDFPNEPGCTSTIDFSEANPTALPDCSDGEDDDGDGFIDFPDDPGCNSAGDPTENNNPPAGGPICGDGIIDNPPEECESGIDCRLQKKGWLCHQCICYNSTLIPTTEKDPGGSYKGPAGEVPPGQRDPKDPNHPVAKPVVTPPAKVCEQFTGDEPYTLATCCDSDADCTDPNEVCSFDVEICKSHPPCGACVPKTVSPWDTTGFDGCDALGTPENSDTPGATINAAEPISLGTDNPLADQTDQAAIFNPMNPGDHATLTFENPTVPIVDPSRVMVYLDISASAVVTEQIMVEAITIPGPSPAVPLSVVDELNGQIQTTTSTVGVFLDQLGVLPGAQVAGVKFSMVGAPSGEVFFDNICFREAP